MKEKLIEAKALIDSGKYEEAKALIDEVIAAIPETMSDDGGDEEGVDVPLPGEGNNF